MTWNVGAVMAAVYAAAACYRSNRLRTDQHLGSGFQRQGLQIGSPEEVAWRRGYIDDAAFAGLIEPIKESEYGKYLQRLLARG